MRSCEGLLRQAMLHLLKLHPWPASRSVAHWQQETGTLLDDAALHFAPSMHQRMDVDALYGRALRRFRSAADHSGPARRVPDVCPFTLDALLSGETLDLLEAVRTRLAAGSVA